MFTCCCAGNDDTTTFMELEENKGVMKTIGVPLSTAAPNTDGQIRDTFAEDEEPAPKKDVPVSAQIFKVVIQKPALDTPLGLHLDLSDPALIHVSGVRAGSTPVSAYNAAAPEGLKMQAGDYIMSVNGVSGDAAKMTEAIQASVSLELELRRPFVFQCVINKDGKPLGLELNYATSGQSLVIDVIDQGAAMDWGAANPALALRKGDRILAINGKRGVAVELLKLMVGSNPVTFELSRPADK